MVDDDDPALAAAPAGEPAPERRELLRAGESVLFIDSKDREYLKTLRPGGRVSLRGGMVAADDLIGTPEGRMVRNPKGESFLMLRPTFAELIPNLPRRAQVIYPKDIALILLWGDIGPGMQVLEAGTGPGALTMALLRAVGPNGSLTSCEIRPEFIDMARGNVAQFYGDAPHWSVVECDVRQGLPRGGLDRIVLDLPEPWTVLGAAAEGLRPGGVLVVYLPTVLQVKQVTDQAPAAGFGRVQVMESLLRPWHSRGLSIRPEHRMVAHTGFIIVCRRVV
ncbi:tRNA (adenine-N1)-methyltransferase, partial [bacterium]|nr:tRNA (adenine-N1)-methyltransferase [bacterium]